MIILLLLIAIAIIVACLRELVKMDEFGDNADPYLVAVTLALIVLIIDGVAGIAVLSKVQSANVLGDKITMYSEVNTALEEEIKASVERYMEHEKGTYEALSLSDAFAVATAYPNLVSNQLVQSQIQTYKENKAQITRLKEEQIDAKIARWWLYFGN